MSRAEDTRARIIKAAQYEFAAHGFANATVRDIIGRAEVNQAAINYHFGGKRELYLEVLHNSFAVATSHAVVSDTLDAMPREEALRAFVLTMIAPISTEEADIHRRILLWEALAPSDAMARLHDSYLSPHFAMVRRLAARFVSDNQTNDLTGMTAIWLLGQCLGFHHARNDPGSPFRAVTDHRRVEDIADLIVRLAIGGLQSLKR